MIIANLSALLAGPRMVSRQPPAPEICIVVRGRFGLVPGGTAVLLPADRQGMLSADTFAPDDDELTGAVQVPGDFADWKPRTDLLLTGACHPPGGRPAALCMATFGVGGWSKSLLAVGPRTVGRGGVATSPEPFTAMPVTWANAFGGPGLRANPAGCGWNARPGDRLPTIGPWDIRQRPPELVGVPAGFAALSPYWPLRWDKVGRDYGKSYQDTRAPFFARDFDWTHFNEAPPDQQIDARLRGDEWLHFGNLHPAHPTLRSQLPGLRVRVILHMVDKQGADGRWVEVPMAIDTLHAEPGALAVTLAWRGHAPVTREDLGDVAAMLVAAEPAGSAPVADATYREAVLEMERAMVTPPDPAMLAVMRGHIPPDGKLPGVPAAAQAGITAALDRAKAAGVDATGHMADMLGRIASSPRKAPAPGLPRAAADALRKVPELLARAPGPASQAALDNPALKGLLDSLARPVPDSLRGDLRGRDLGRQDLSRLDMSGFDLTGARLAGARLHGTRLDGAVLEDADLTGADLAGAILTGARMDRAVLAGAVLDRAILSDAALAGADLRGASLAGAVASGVQAAGARLTRARLRLCGLAGAGLAGADLQEAILDGCDLSGANLDGVQAAGSRWTSCTMNGLRAAGADFTGAVLAACGAPAAQAPRAVFARCRLDGTNVSGADLSGAVFAGARGLRMNWMDARLDGADLRQSQFHHALFNGMSADGADFTEADLSHARFRRARLVRTRFVHAKLLECDFDGTLLQEVRFDEAQLFSARFYKVEGGGNTTTGAAMARLIVVHR